MLESILETFHSPCAVFDLNGNVRFSNKRFDDISSTACVESDEMEGREKEKCLKDLLFNAFLVLNSQQSLKEPGPIARPVVVSAKDSEGKELSFEAEFSLIESDAGKEILCILRDITHYREVESELENKEEFLWLLMFNLPIGLIFVKPETRTIEDLNLEAANLIGVQREYMLNKRCNDIFICNGKSCFAFDSTDTTYRGECLLIRHDGSKIPVLRTVKLLSTGDSQVVMEAFFDLSEQKRLEEKLKNLSITDALTGAYNRRFFVERLNQEIGRAKRYGEPFCVVMLDLDHFKSINDNFGHAKGDEVLIGTVATIRSRIRATDVLARWGGEEFAILLPSTDLKGAVTLAETIRERLREKDYGIGKRITSSFGISPYILGDSVDAIMSRADSMLYQAKASGRDCIRCYEP